LINDASFAIHDGDMIELAIQPEPVLRLQPKQIPLELVFEDEYLAVINKPAGLSVHPGAGNNTDTLVNALLARYNSGLSSVGGPDRLGIVHRLDKNTSGLMIIAKTDQTHQKLAELLTKHQVIRVYQALVWGCLPKLHGTVEGSIGRSMRDRTKMSVVKAGGKHAVTHYRTLRIFPNRGASLVECRLETGRTHQIRVHLSHLGHAIIGDFEYANKHIRARKCLTDEARSFIKDVRRQMLHSKALSFTHPITGALIEQESALPSDMNKLIEVLSK
jgi:23S rRNA pseudouridine1911/1915/1917 synthase